jgi:hypothetical protein
MRAKLQLRGGCFLVLFLTLAAGPSAAAGEKTTSAALVQDRVAAGGPADFLEARHIVLKGTNEEIGRALAGIARDRFSSQPLLSSDPLRTRVRRRYLEAQYPILLERMRGVANCFGKRLDDDSLDFGLLAYPQPRMGCSVVYYPPGTTADGNGVVSRNFDFGTGTMRGVKPPPGQLAATARPYIVEMYPDRGYPSLAICSYDLLSGVMDGINSEGLTVALLADDELQLKFRMEATGGEAVGLGALQVQRYLLDTCANVEEAKEALLLTKQYYEFLSVHYLVADRHGKAFIWEYSQAHNREYIIENPGEALVTTNFSLHRYLEGKTPPSAARAKQVCRRYCALADGISQHQGKVSLEFIKQNQKAADATGPALSSSRVPVRTLWHALYFPNLRRVQVSFYLHDEAGRPPDGKPRIVRSEYLDFPLSSGLAHSPPR